MKFPFNRVSASAINAYNDCPRGYYITAILELMTEEGPALEIGSILDFMFKQYHEGKDWLKEAKKKYLNGKFPTSRIKNFGQARELMEVYSLNPDTFVNPSFDIKIEVPIINPITEEKIEGIVLKGYLDGFDQGRIKELKSTTQPYDQQRVDEAIQATIYAYGKYMTDGEIYPIDYIVLGKKTKVVDRFTTTRTLDDFDKLFNIIKKFIKNVEAEKFNKNPNHAFYCVCRKIQL